MHTNYQTVSEFVPNDKNEVKIYTCGPTVYSYAHIGNMRNYINHDVFHKTLLYLGYNVKRAMNITDVGHLTSDSDSGEDKMLKAVRKENKTAMEIADYYTKAFFKDFKLVNCRMPDIVSPATENIDMYIKIIEKLLKDGYAYISGGNVYFDVSKLDDYYKLTNHKADDMVVGVREGVEYDGNKRNQADFALWFTTSKFEHHELMWDSPWGNGYPGWHIECTGISIRYLGEYLDVHGGAVDNIFPHHTNEIAQSEAYLGHKWCNYWFHNEFLVDETGKMGKSKGATLSVSFLQEEGYSPLAYRFMCLNSHYRKQLLFTYEALDQAQKTLNKLKNKIASIPDDGVFEENIYKQFNDRFKEQLENDLNTANALSVLYDVIKQDGISGKTKYKLISDFDTVLSLDLLKKDELSEDLASYVKKQIELRKEAKQNKNYELADKIRNELLEKSIVLKDTKDGTVWEIN